MRTALLSGLLAAAVGFTVSSPTLAAGDPVAGKTKNSMCAGCHGIPNYRTAYPAVFHVPKLGGQHPEYIVQALKAYKNGDRKHPTMQAIAASLSEQDMEDLAAYYADVKSGAAK